MVINITSTYIELNTQKTYGLHRAGWFVIGMPYTSWGASTDRVADGSSASSRRGYAE
jgi:hypothetical protein